MSVNKCENLQRYLKSCWHSLKNQQAHVDVTFVWQWTFHGKYIVSNTNNWTNVRNLTCDTWVLLKRQCSNNVQLCTNIIKTVWQPLRFQTDHEDIKTH